MVAFQKCQSSLGQSNCIKQLGVIYVPVLHHQAHWDNLGCSMPQPSPLWIFDSYDTGIEIWWREVVEALGMGLFSRNSQCLLLLCQWCCVMWWKLYLCIFIPILTWGLVVLLPSKSFP
jgi:hypothetical protein